MVKRRAQRHPRRPWCRRWWRWCHTGADGLLAEACPARDVGGTVAGEEAAAAATRPHVRAVAQVAAVLDAEHARRGGLTAGELDGAVGRPMDGMVGENGEQGEGEHLRGWNATNRETAFTRNLLRECRTT